MFVDDQDKKPEQDDRPVYIDNGSISDEENNSGKLLGTPRKPPPIPIARARSFDTLSRRTSFSQQSRDPNFNIIPKLKKHVQHVPLEKLNESQMSETQIINGVAVTTSIATIDNVTTLENVRLSYIFPKCSS